MGPKNNFTIDSKVELLEHLIKTSQDWTDPDLASFFQHVERTFDGFKGTTWEGQDLETKLRKEERLWLAECNGTVGRRRGHEKDSLYDTAMARWKRIWSKLLIKDWQNEVDHGRPWDEVPPSLRDQLDFPELSRPKTAPAPAQTVTPKPKPTASPVKSVEPTTKSTATRPVVTLKLRRKVSPVKAAETTTRSTAGPVENFRFEYDGQKLKTVVDAATKRARETGKMDLAEAVQSIYMECQENMELRYLLEHILQQTANEEQNVRFQDYVRAAKRKIKAQKAQRLQDEERSRRAKKVAYRAAVSKQAGSKRDSNTMPLDAKEDGKLCTETQWSDTCPCSKCKRDKAEFNEDMTGVADVEHRSKYEEFMRKNGLDAGATKGPPRVPPHGAQRQKIEKESPKQQRAADWPVSDVEDEVGGVPVGGVPNAQPKTEQTTVERNSDAPARAHGSPTSAETGVPSDSGYETTEKQPHHDPLVTKILGDFQYEPSVEKLLQYNKALPTNANIKDLRQRESALEAIKTIVMEAPAAKTDLNVLLQKLQERDVREAEADGTQVTVESEDGAAEEIAESSEEDSEDEYEQGKDEDVTPRTTRTLRSHTSTGEDDGIDRTNSERRRNHKWPCPMSKEAGCDQWFSSSGHAVRHGKIHTGVKDYSCPECNKAFARKDNMMEHFRGVHRNCITSNKRGRRASTQSSTAIGEETDRLAADWEAKRRRSARHAALDEVDSDASRQNSVLSDKSTDSSLTELSSADMDPVHDYVASPRRQEKLNEQVVGPLASTASGQNPTTVIERLEAKMDELLNGRATNRSTEEGKPAAGGPDAEHAMVSSAESLLQIATSLQAGASEGQSAELIQFVARLTKTAAEAVIEASNSARQSAEMARDISLLLERNMGDFDATANDSAVQGAV